MSPVPVAVGRPRLGDGPFFDLNVHSADGQVNWDDVFGSGYYYFSFSTSTIGTAAQYSLRWWVRDFGEGGLFDIKVDHVIGNDVGIYSFRIDGREVARLDGYNSTDVLKETVVATQLRIEPGRHRFEIRIDGANPSSTGLKFYPALLGVLFRRTAPLARGRRGTLANPLGAPAPSLAGQVIDLIPVMAGSGTVNWTGFTSNSNMLHGYEHYTSSAQNDSKWWDLDLAAGVWLVELSCITFSQAGIYNIQLDGVTVGTIDGYSASTLARQKKTALIVVPKSGTQRFKLLMATKNGSSSAYYGDISNLQLRQVSGAPPLPHRIVNWVCQWSSGNVNWFQPTANTGWAYGCDFESSGAQNDAIWWEKDLAAGTWDFELLHTTGGNRGIYTVMVDGRSVGTIDGFGGTAANVHGTITGIVIPWSGTHEIRLVMATKNGGSSNYYGTIQVIQMRRTS